MRTRPNTMDAYVLKEIEREYGLLPVAGLTVLDLGGHIGGFGRWALDNGAARVIAFEAYGENAALYRENVPEAELHHVAVVGDDRPTVTLNVSRGTNTGSHSILKNSASRFPVEVSAISFDGALGYAAGEPLALKIDIEGAEYGFAQDLLALPPNVGAIAMELHLGRKAWRAEALDLVEAFSAQGFTALRTPQFTRAAWHVQGVWSRIWTTPST